MATEPNDTATQGQARDRRQADGAGTRTTTDRLKRVAAGLLGGFALVRGLRRRSRRGIVLAVAGGWLVARALGLRPGRRTLAVVSGARSRVGDRRSATEQPSVTRTITIGASAEDLSELWRDPDQLSRIVGHFADVEAADEDVFRWTAHAPGGRDVSWDTRFVDAEPGERLRWETPGDAMIQTEGELRFRQAPGDRGTLVELTIDFDPPGGTVGATALDRLDVVPETAVAEALRRFKRLAETGEIPTLEGNPSARGRGDLA